jgi:TM2 domain-containing membrane protein YozV
LASDGERNSAGRGILGEEVIQMNNESLVCSNKEIVSAENKWAAFLSIIVPGLGQIYKGHAAAGLLWLFLGMPIAVWAGILLGLATAGLGLLFPLLCWAGVAVDAYYEKDLRIHHWFPPRDCQA